jgi:hypothetical protein
MTNRAPLIVAIVLLLLPVLYVGSYFALLRSGPSVTSTGLPSGQKHTRITNYKVGGERLDWFFWPAEETDRRLRPATWGKRLRGGVHTHD